MELHEYPRPQGDTGIGVHWSAGFPASVGLGRVRDFWLPELQAMGVKWVKLARHDGGLEIIDLLVAHDIMPIVRVMKPAPNPGRLGAEELRVVRELVAAGVRYIEFNNEPDQPREWEHGLLPPDALEVVARNAIADMEAILEAGGCPGIPALSVGSQWDLLGEICRLGGAALLSGHVWQATHNFGLNHPLDYPSDAGNQAGAPYRRDFYDQLAGETWTGDAWGGWSLERVNEARRTGQRPGATAVEDAACWRAYERDGALARQHLGRNLPVLATAGGWVVGNRDDLRYPAVTPQWHAALTVEACRSLMGTSSQTTAPDYFFCSSFWLLANYGLGHFAPGFEAQAWYSDRWPGGRLPAVAALQAERKQARPLPEITAAAPGQEETAAGIDLDQPVSSEAVPDVVSGSFVRGRVRGGAGLKVRLAKAEADWVSEQILPGDAAFTFAGLAPGTYVVELPDRGVCSGSLALDGSNTEWVELAPPGWGWESADGGASPGFGVVRCRVEGRPGAAVRLIAAGWDGLVAHAGDKLEYGPDVCEFAPLGAGRYRVEVEGAAAAADVSLDGRRVVWLTFVETAEPVPAESAVQGLVRGGAGRRLALDGPDGQRAVTIAADGSYSFDGLGPGEYRLALAGAGLPAPAITLDGRDASRQELEVPAEHNGAIRGTVLNGAGHLLRLQQWPSEDWMAETAAGPGGNYRFERLGPGAYSVVLLGPAGAGEIGQQQPQIEIDGGSEVQVHFALPNGDAGWSWVIRDGGPGRGFSVVRCQVVGEQGRRVRLWAHGWNGCIEEAGSKLDLGRDVCEFAPLGSGHYYIDVVGAGVRAEFELAHDRVVWVQFQQSAGVSGGRSLVSGTVTNGDGKTVVLRGPLGEKRAVVAGGRYTIDNLPAGAYRLTIEESSPMRSLAQPEHEVVLDGYEPATVDFVLPGFGLTGSRVSGRIHGGADHVLELQGPDGRRAQRVGTDEMYSFAALAPGTYRLYVAGLGELRSGIQLNGINAAQVDYDLVGPAIDKTIDHYLYIGNLARSREDYLAVLQYVARFQPAVGSAEPEARQARHVTILGNNNAVPAAVEQALRASGSEVQRIESNYAEVLGRLLERGSAY